MLYVTPPPPACPQTLFRIKMSRREAERLREERFQRQCTRAAILMQVGVCELRHVCAHTHAHLSHAAAQSLVLAVANPLVHCPPVASQKIFRGKRARDIMALARAARSAYFRKCTEAASNIQRIYRGRRGRKLYKKLLKASKALKAAQEENSVELVVRGHRPGKRSSMHPCHWRTPMLLSRAHVVGTQPC